jgi:hypothetical protein
MAMNSRVLIGFADALAGIESGWCLAEHGFEVYAFTRRGVRPAIARSPAIHVVEVTKPEDDALACAAEIVALARDLCAAAVLPLDDYAVWLCDRAFEESSQATVAGPRGRLAVLALDKREQLQRAGAAGFAVPASDLTAARPPGRGPWMVKPALAVELRAGRLCRGTGRTATTTEQVGATAAAIGGPTIVQRQIAGVGEGVFGLATAGQVTVLSAHRRIRMMNPRGSGSSACRSAPVPDEVIGPVRNMITACGWRGLFMIELLRDAEGCPWFMELNGRAWGSMALARRRGYPYPSWAVRAALEPAFIPAEPPESPPVTVRHLGREIVHLGTVLARGGAPRLATARDVLTVRRSDRWYNYRPGEADVLAADTWATLRAQIAPRISRRAR